MSKARAREELPGVGKRQSTVYRYNNQKARTEKK
jgi:hypothetical protein